MKRSVSPQSTPEGKWQKKPKVGLGIFSAIKRAFSAVSNDEQSSSRIPTDDVKIDIQNDEISNSFLTRKRSVHSNGTFSRATSSTIPRASVSGPSGKFAYDSLLNTLASEGKTEPKLGLEIDLEREVSPSVYLHNNSILPLNPEEMELEAFESEPEFDSLYRDENGNLVRPPFINLDPKERYQMLQMKKSVQATQALQESLKYMVDPDETTSITRPGNMVDTSTQTHTSDYLENRLHFNKVLTKRALANRSHRKRLRTPFSGDFSYDRSEAIKKDRSNSKLQGYLGEVSKPKFLPNTTSKAPASIQTRHEEVPGSKFPGISSHKSNQLDQAYIDRANKLSSILRVKDQSSEPSTKSVGPSSGFSFEMSKDKFTTASHTPAKESAPLSGSIPKSTELNADSSSKDTKPLFAPPSDDGTQDDRPAKKTRTREDSSQSTEASKPLFSLGTAPASKSENSTKPSSIPKINFGSTDIPTTKPSVPSFALQNGSSNKRSQEESKEREEPKESDAKKSSAVFGEKVPLPKFSFGAQQSDTTKEKSSGLASITPSLSGTVSSSDSGAKSSGSTLFGSNAEKPAFTFGASKTDDTKAEKPAFSFGATKTEESKPDKSAFTFGASKTDDAKTQKPAFSFGTSNEGGKTEKPAFSFGASKTEAAKSETPAFSFGASKDDTAQSKKPAFSFGMSKTEDSKSDKPAFAFGGKPALGGPTLSFGSTTQGKEEEAGHEKKNTIGSSGELQEAKNEKQATPFSFGKVGTPVSVDSNSEAGNNKPTFSFGKQTPTNSETKPSFSFGQATNGDAKSESQPASAPAFSFGNTEKPASANTSFSFGQSATADPALIFGNTGTSAPAPAFNFSVNATPKATTPLAAPQGNTAGGFSFSNGAIAGLGSRSSTPATTGVKFGAATNNGAIMGSAPSFNFGGTSAPAFAPATGVPAFGDRARTATPSSTVNPFAFGQTQATPAFGGGNEGGFSFSNNAVSNNAFNSAPGSFGQPSRDNTPPAFGGIGGGFPQASAPGQQFTPPVANASGRRIAQMRQRKRF